MRSPVDDGMQKELSNSSSHYRQRRPLIPIGWRQFTQALVTKTEPLNFWKKVIYNILPTWRISSPILFGTICVPTPATPTYCAEWDCHNHSAFVRGSKPEGWEVMEFALEQTMDNKTAVSKEYALRQA